MARPVIRHKVQLPEHVGPLLRSLRVQQGISQKDLAARLGVTPPSLSHLEDDASNASIRRIMRVLAELDMELVVQPRERWSVQEESPPW